MFGTRYCVTCNDCSIEYTFKNGKAARAFYDACNCKCPRCGNRLWLWVPLMREMLTPPPELKLYNREVHVINMW